MMQERTVTHSTFVIERSFPVPADRVFAALADPAKKRRWYTGGRTMELQEFEMDFQPGGRDRLLYIFSKDSPFPGAPIVYESVYQDIVPGRRIVVAYSMTIAGRRISASLATFELMPTAAGTDLVFTEQGAFFEGSDGPQMREDGWRKLLDRLAEYLAA
jgi:uncharacterized protein YndB with AHSA1/START domain